jgi:hypothetical protein
MNISNCRDAFLQLLGKPFGFPWNDNVVPYSSGLAQVATDGTLLAIEIFWRGGRAVDCAGLENRKAKRPREFESHPLRQPVDAARTLIGRSPECFRRAEIRTERARKPRHGRAGRQAEWLGTNESMQFDSWGALRAWVKIPPPRDHSPEPKRSFG